MFRIAAIAVFLVFASAVLARDLTFEPYYPNRMTRIQVYDYLSTAEGESTWRYEGRLVRRPGGERTRDGSSYDTVIHRAEGLPDFFPAEWITWHRETGEGLFTAQENKAGQLDETLEFPASAIAGESWDAPASFWAEEIPEPVARLETAVGTLEDCVVVRRGNRDERRGQTLTNTTTYCAGHGAVREVTELVTPEVRSVTTVRLAGFREE